VQDYAPAQPGRPPPRGDSGSDASLIHYDGKGVYSMNFQSPTSGILGPPPRAGRQSQVNSSRLSCLFRAAPKRSTRVMQFWAFGTSVVACLSARAGHELACCYQLWRSGISLYHLTSVLNSNQKVPVFRVSRFPKKR
jgi:hypothetical protein